MLNKLEIIYNFLLLTKPRIVLLVIFSILTGMILSTNKILNIKNILFITLGLWLLTSSAFVLNSILDNKIDIKMSRTKNRPLVKNKITLFNAIIFFIILNIIGLIILYKYSNKLTFNLTIITFIGYALIYTIFLKKYTVKNIIIGGIFGAMPPLLGWVSITNNININSLILTLIIFLWTPPHFWSLSLIFNKDYKSVNIPILPNIYGINYTIIQIYIYVILLSFFSIIPYLIKMSNKIYFLSSIMLNSIFIFYIKRLYIKFNLKLAKKIFYYSIIYLFILLLMLNIDHLYYIYY